MKIPLYLTLFAAFGSAPCHLTSKIQHDRLQTGANAGKILDLRLSKQRDFITSFQSLHTKNHHRSNNSR